ncbi:hypothetical protein TBLA_0F00420 [Henningerozyma blattae CBS 6284]|uniref:Attractin/MKLN-like beta-propeller domain-containing protein n=1 Tax=Henningerozyma blattae (strain ATCC 34711 / CBS 6284 / DSM 70876 / NBRC 10599 / NRRL Y-10934 / UCD 77-7) TaxID=1071380 RepID=I2H5D4_HENB6|nr:hypothetical protein TBLA_0F00420 [Tetrapisispora blattae CBS 6284]CCH61586.1 hypothetical protein TBLA_0F00420 [Tetrapisispora blattae CBS 6284]
MHILQPSSCNCYTLDLPSLPENSVNLDESVKRKLKLDCRTGAAVELSRSDIFVHGGLTIPLNLNEINLAQVQKEIIMYFAKESTGAISFKTLADWISSELFFLDLISRSWQRVETSINHESLEMIKKRANNTDYYKSNGTVMLRERFYHSLCYTNSSLYMFGGLIVNPNSSYELTPTNTLWKLDLETKVWTLLSMDSRITERFAHSMHVKNENDEIRDTKLIIVGGLNKDDENVNSIDIFNLSHNCWEVDFNTKYRDKVKTNIDNQVVSLSPTANFSILVEKNEANIPAIAFYSPYAKFNNSNSNSDLVSLKNQDNSSTSSSTHSQTYPHSTHLPHKHPHTSHSHSLHNKKLDPVKTTTNLRSPFVALPLLPDSKGMRLASIVQKSDTIENTEAPYNLLFPTGDHFGYNIISAGFFPNGQASNFHCFNYDIHTGKCTKLSIQCSDYEISKHRFWRLFVWQSHFQGILLGTKEDDKHLPTVQRFDFISTFPLPVLSTSNMYNIAKQPQVPPLRKSGPNITTHQNFKENERSLKEDDPQVFRKLSFASTATSQFESYIRYIAPPKETATIRSIFPSYAMVLGKDAWEIFGGSLSDFEIITDEGDSIGVPMYLLRKRWGRYFDMLLSQGYSRACAEYDAARLSSNPVNPSPRNSPGPTSAPSRKPSDVSSASSLSNHFNNMRKQSVPGIQLTAADESKRNHSLTASPIAYDNVSSDECPLSHIIGYNDYDDPVASPLTRSSNTASNNPYKKISAAHSPGRKHSSKMRSKSDELSVTSSSNGMVFRVPFQEKDGTTSNPHTLPEKFNFNKEKRRSSVAVMSPADLTNSKNIEPARRASHPNPSPTGIDDIRNHVALRFSSSTHNSRKASVASQGSSISFVSSTSDRMGNSLYPPPTGGGSVHSSILGILNIVLPPQPDIPNEPLPPIPHDLPSFFSRRRNSFAEFVYSNKSSPLSSRRSSTNRCLSLPELKSPDSLPITPPLPLLEKDTEYENCSPNTTPLHHRRSSAKTSIANSSRNNSFSRGFTHGDFHRPSITSTADSADNGPSSFVLEFEPLLTPRSLYMPWSTETISAFAEFFFTGQVNGKWMLAPVVLNLLVMSKIYEIPLLFTLVTEVLYAIIGRKEESLFITCDSMIELFHSKVSRHFEEDLTTMNNYLMSVDVYCDLIKLKNSLEDIENGFFDAEIIKKMSRGYSLSTTESGEGDINEKFSPRVSNATSFVNYVPTVFAGGPRDSHNSIGSFSFPTQTPRESFTGFNSKVKKKSSLNKEIDFFDTQKGLKAQSGDSIDDMGNTSHLTVDPMNDDTGMSDITLKLSNSQLHMNDSGVSGVSGSRQTSGAIDPKGFPAEGGIPDDLKEQLEQAKLCNLSEMDDLFIDKSINVYQKNESRQTMQLPADEYSSSQSDSDEFDSELGVLSMSKMRRKVVEGHALDDSVDPLFKIQSGNTSPSKNPSTRGKQTTSTGGSGRASREDIAHLDLNIPTIENLTSPNALPPVDYIMKSIYRTAVLVNDVKLIVRCLNAIEISKLLKAMRKRISFELGQIDDNRDSNYLQSKGENFRMRALSNTKSISPESSSASLSMMSNMSTEAGRRGSPRLSTQIPSPKTPTSMKNFERNIKNPSQNKKGNSRHSNISSNIPATSTAVLMNPGVMPPLPPSSNPKSKKDNAKNAGGFSFFGKKRN